MPRAHTDVHSDKPPPDTHARSRIHTHTHTCSGTGSHARRRGSLMDHVVCRRHEECMWSLESREECMWCLESGRTLPLSQHHILCSLVDAVWRAQLALPLSPSHALFFSFGTAGPPFPRLPSSPSLPSLIRFLIFCTLESWVLWARHCHLHASQRYRAGCAGAVKRTLPAHRSNSCIRPSTLQCPLQQCLLPQLLLPQSSSISPLKYPLQCLLLCF